MVLIVLEVLQMLLFAGLAWMVAKLYDRIEKLEVEQLEDAEEWKPVDLSDQREYELEEQEKRRSYFYS